MSFWSTLADELDSDGARWVAIVADHTRHSPGTRGARLLVRPDGSQFGTIGGGIMEADLLRRAVQALDEGEGGSTTETLHHREDADGPQSGLICAGAQTLVYFVARPEDAPIYARFAESRRDDIPCELIVEEGRPRLTERHDAVDRHTPPLGLRDDVYWERAILPMRVVIAGGGHCGLALSRQMAALDYRVTVVDERNDLFTMETNDAADEQVVVDTFRSIGEAVSFPEITHAVVMTAAMDGDIRALLGLAHLDLAYAGVMGSSAKLARIRGALEEAGAGDFYRRLYAPIGLEMTSNTPAEIAVSVASQILREREKLFPWSAPSAAGVSS